MSLTFVSNDPTATTTSRGWAVKVQRPLSMLVFPRWVEDTKQALVSNVDGIAPGQSDASPRLTLVNVGTSSVTYTLDTPPKPWVSITGATTGTIAASSDKDVSVVLTHITGGATPLALGAHVTSFLVHFTFTSTGDSLGNTTVRAEAEFVAGSIVAADCELVMTTTLSATSPIVGQTMHFEVSSTARSKFLVFSSCSNPLRQPTAAAA